MPEATENPGQRLTDPAHEQALIAAANERRAKEAVALVGRESGLSQLHGM